MRAQIIESIFQRMVQDPDVFFLTADMGINLVEKFEEKYPARFLNVGIAEQNLVGVSAGLVNLGYRPFAYTISNFVIHRCFEQIRNEIGIHDYPVTLLGTSTGYDNAPLGPTHHIIDEWGVLKSIPEIDIYRTDTSDGPLAGSSSIGETQFASVFTKTVTAALGLGVGAVGAGPYSLVNFPVYIP